MSRNRRIMLVVNVDWFFLSHRLPIALEAIKRGDEVHIATRITGSAEELVRHGLIVHPLKFGRTDTSLFGSILAFYQLFMLFRKFKPDLVHLVTIKPVLLGGLAARFAGVGAVVSAISGLGHIFTSRTFKARILRRIAGFLYRFVLNHPNQRVIFQNANDRAQLKLLAGLEDRKIEMMDGSGVDLELFSYQPLPENPKLVLFASRLLSSKGIEEFVEAARICLNKHHVVQEQLRFVIVGSPDPDNPESIQEDDLNRWVEEGVVEYWNYRSDMAEVLAQSHIVTLPSYYGEGLPKILIEAAASGRAIVTTDHPGCRDAIEPGVTGVLVPVRDAKALAGAIMKLLEDPGQIEAMGRAGRSMAEKRFDVRQIVRRHLELYDELIKVAG